MVVHSETASTAVIANNERAATERTEAGVKTENIFEIKAQEDVYSETSNVQLEQFYDANDMVLADSTTNGVCFKKMFSKYYMACAHYILSMLCLVLPACVQIKNWGHKAFLLGQYSFLRAVTYWNGYNAPVINMNTLVAHFRISWGCSNAVWARFNLVVDKCDFYLTNTTTWFVPFGLQFQLALALISDLLVMRFDIGFFLIASCWPMLGISLINLQTILNMLCGFGQRCLIAGVAAVTTSLKSVYLDMTAAVVRYYASLTAGLNCTINFTCDSYFSHSETVKKLTFSVETVAAQIEQALIAVEMFWPGFLAVAPVFVLLFTRFLCTVGCWEAWFCHTVVDMMPDTFVTCIWLYTIVASANSLTCILCVSRQ